MVMIELIQELIKIPSTSGQETQISDFVQTLIKDKRTIRFDNNIIWKNEWLPKRPTVALGAHLDTVPFDEKDWKITHPLTPIIDGDKLYGRGACDMKSGAAILLDILLKRDFDSHYNLLFFWYEMEELGIPNGVTKMIQRGFFDGVDLCIIPEPTECKVNNGVFGNLDARITARGKSAHSAYPKRGDNAIYRLLPVIEAIRDYPLETIQGVREAMSVNIIQGGNAINVIPDQAYIEMDYRYNPDKSEKEIRELLSHWQSENIFIDILGLNPGVLHPKGVSPLLDRLIAINDEPMVVPFWSDIGQLGAAGITAVNFGPGSIRQAHIVDEYVPLSEVEKVRQQLVQFLTQSTYFDEEP